MKGGEGDIRYIVEHGNMMECKGGAEIKEQGIPCDDCT